MRGRYRGRGDRAGRAVLAGDPGAFACWFTLCITVLTFAVTQRGATRQTRAYSGRSIVRSQRKKKERNVHALCEFWVWMSGRFF